MIIAPLELTLTTLRKRLSPVSMVRDGIPAAEKVISHEINKIQIPEKQRVTGYDSPY